MATQLFLRGSTAGFVENPTATQGDRNWQTSSGPMAGGLKTARGSGVEVNQVNTQAGPVAPGAAQVTGEFITEPLSADVTISGVITCNIWSAESAAGANVAINFECAVLRADGTVETIVVSARVTELPTARAAQNFTATPGAGVLVNKGDRIRVYFFGDDAGTMASGFNFNVGYDGATPAADGDSYITFTEDFTFMPLAAGGATLYLRDTISDVATAAIDRVAWTTRGPSAQSDVLDADAGSAIFQWTDSFGGTAVEWYSPQLQAFTLADVIECNIRAADPGNNGSELRVEVARVESDGSGAVVFGTWMGDFNDGPSGFGAFATTEGATTCWVSGDDLAFSDGHRIRIRVLADVHPQLTNRADSTLTMWYDGPTGGASGDSWIRLNQTPLELEIGEPGYQRIAGPALLDDVATTLYTVPARQRTEIRSLDLNNPSGSLRKVTLSIGTDAAGTRVEELYDVPANDSVNLRRGINHTLEATEVLQGYCDVADVVVVTINAMVEEL